MSKRFHGALAAVLAFVLVLSLFPTVALPAQAAEGDVSSEGYVIFEETFEKGEDGNFLSGRPGNAYDSLGGTVADGYITFTNGSTSSSSGRKNVTFKLSDLGIASRVGGDNWRGYVGIKIEVFITESTERNAWVQIVDVTTANGTYTSSNNKFIEASQSSITPPKTSASGVFGITDGTGEVTEMTVRLGVREATAATNYLKVDGYRVSLVLVQRDGYKVAAQDMGMYLTTKTGYFQLQEDLSFASYANGGDVTDLIMGNNAVLDLNGHTLTIAEGSTLSVPVNAKIVDSSAGKTGKIICAKDALTIANTDHPTLPVWTGNGYVLTEPKLEADKHIMVVADSQNHDQFKLHLRPGFGTLSNGTVNVRETYLADGNNDITMSAFITSVDLYGNRYNLQNAGSEEIVLDGMFDGMYASELARCQIAFEGFEKYQALEITIKLSAMGVVYTLPTYTVENTYITKYYASQFNYGEADYKIAQGTYSVTEAGKLSYTGNTLGFTLANPINTGAGNKLVIEGDIDFASSGIKTGFEVRGTTIDNSNRYYLFVTNQYATQNGYHHVVQKNDIVGEKHIRLEIDLNTFAVVCTIDGVSDAAVTPSAAELEYFLSAWNNKDVILASASGHSASTPLVFDNLLIYTIKTA